MAINLEDIGLYVHDHVLDPCSLIVHFFKLDIRSHFFLHRWQLLITFVNWYFLVFKLRLRGHYYRVRLKSLMFLDSKSFLESRVFKLKAVYRLALIFDFIRSD